MPEDKKRTFDDDDLFQRKPYADFLKNLILNCDNYHRDDDVKAYTIALDSPWGTGKSVFLEKFEAMLEQDCQDQLRVVHYNAWENDFWDNAFEPFADAVFSHPLFASPLADQTKNRSVEKFGIAMKHLAVAFTKKQLENYFDSEQLAEAGSALAGAVGNYVSSDPNAVSPAYSAYKKNLQEMQAAMETVLQESIPDGKLVIIIDELDRCRPTFAIETLEIVKHVMDVPNVVYLFALDVQQLGAAIKKVYGAETDATGYLMRFFSYYARLPGSFSQNIVVIEKAVKFAGLHVYADQKEYNQFLSDLLNVALLLSLNLRDIETVCKVYGMMGKAFLSAYENSHAYLLYWLLLCCKYKNPPLFDSWIQDSLAGIAYPFSEKIQKKIPTNILVAMQKARDPLQLKYLSLKVKLDSCDTTQLAEIHVFVDEIQEDCIRISNSKPGLGVRSLYDIGKQGNLSEILFYQDLLRWEEIKNLTLKQYLSNQLEMFTFLPTIE
nr:MAG TPA: KAP family P-loop domain [Caudoviricetes sp.]